MRLFSATYKRIDTALETGVASAEIYDVEFSHVTVPPPKTAKSPSSEYSLRHAPLGSETLTYPRNNQKRLHRYPINPAAYHMNYHIPGLVQGIGLLGSLVGTRDLRLGLQ